MKKLVFLSFALLIAAFSINAIIATDGDGYEIGDVATDFNLKGTDGEMHSLSSIDGAKGYVVVFTCNHCPFSVMYEDRLIDLHNKFAPMGYPVVAINPNDPEVVKGDDMPGMIKRADEKGFPFMYLMDEGQKIYPQYGATKTPHVFLLDANRVVKYIGAIDNSAKDAAQVSEKYLENAIVAIQNGEEPSPAVTKAIGCSVKCKK